MQPAWNIRINSIHRQNITQQVNSTKRIKHLTVSPQGTALMHRTAKNNKHNMQKNTTNSGIMAVTQCHPHNASQPLSTVSLLCLNLRHSVFGYVRLSVCASQVPCEHIFEKNSEGNFTPILVTGVFGFTCVLLIRFGGQGHSRRRHDWIAWSFISNCVHGSFLDCVYVYALECGGCLCFLMN